MKIKDLFIDERPREKALNKGIESLSNTELLAILLRTGNKENNAISLSHNILEQNFASINKIASSSIENLCKTKGVGSSKAITIKAALELGKRAFNEDCLFDKVAITSSDIAYNILIGDYRNLYHEECWILFLNRANYLIKKEMITKGGMNATIIDSRIIVRKALEYQACGIILSHNHPSGNVNPGEQDVRQTDLLRKALEPFEISLIDHLVIHNNAYFSFAENRILYPNNNMKT